MYKDFYQMKRRIFTAQPHPDIFFDSEVHKKAWDYLLSGIKSQEPFMLVTGNHGTGKTLLCLKLIKLLQKESPYPVVYVPSANFGLEDILHEIVNKLGLVVQGREGSSLQPLLYEYSDMVKGELKPIYVIMDEVNEFDTSTLRELRALANFNHHGIFPIRFIFFAHTSFLDKLKSPFLIALDQRIRRTYHLSSFNLMETKEYIYFQLFISGSSGIPYFSKEAIQQIFTYSGGIPRLINTICDASMLIGAARGLQLIESPVIEQAVESLEWPKREEQETPLLDEEKAEDYDYNEDKIQKEKGLQIEKGDFSKKGKALMILCFLILFSAFSIGFFFKERIYGFVSSRLSKGDNEMREVQSLVCSKQEERASLDNANKDAETEKIRDNGNPNLSESEKVEMNSHTSRLACDIMSSPREKHRNKEVRYSPIQGNSYLPEGD